MLYCKSELYASEPLTSQVFVKKPSQYCMEIFALYSLHSAICFQLHYILLPTTMSAIYNAGTLQVYSKDFARPHCETFEGQ